MSQALFTSMTGLNVAQQSINVVSNNVANINTTAYKAADARFATLFSNTLTAGNAPSATAGGTNPKQIGLGVKLESITRNFRTGSYLSTDNTNDSMIAGAGYYTVMDASGNVFLTRDGGFTLDANGNMITATGNKVLGAAQLASSEASQTSILVPQKMSRTIEGDDNLANLQMQELNNCNFTTGNLNMTITNGDGISRDISVSITEEGGGGDVELSKTITMGTFMTNLQNQINAKISAAFGAEVKPTVTLTPTDEGIVTCDIADTGANNSSLEINNSSSTNIATNLGYYKVTEGTTAESKVLSYKVAVDPAVSPTNMTSLASYTIGSDGSIEATYDNGDKLSVYLDDANQFQFKYITASGVYIYGNDTVNSPVTVNPNVCNQNGFVLQIATVTNEAGLVSRADNLWTIGPDTGEVIFTMAGQLGTGSIETGGLEGSNVDLARELSNMIIAQRAINANSRVFGTASSVLETLSQLGR